MQTATLLRRGAELGVAVAAALIVTETATANRIGEERQEDSARLAGNAAVAALSPTT
jgi:hypothetical protein